MIETGTKVIDENTPFSHEVLTVKTHSGTFMLMESNDGGLRIEMRGPSSLVIMGGNTHDNWSLNSGKVVVIYRSSKGGAVRKGWPK